MAEYQIDAEHSMHLQYTMSHDKIDIYDVSIKVNFSIVVGITTVNFPINKCYQ